MKHSLPARVGGALAGLANGLFGGGGGMVFVPLLSRWGGLSPRKLYPTCVAVIFPVCTVSAVSSVQSSPACLQPLHWAVSAQ